MQLDNTASPKAQTPQLRYSSLHRTIEKGLASDEVWNELARICLVLGFNDEAVKAYRKVEGAHASRYLEILMARHGLVSMKGSSTRLAAMQPSRYRHSSAVHQIVESEPRGGIQYLAVTLVIGLMMLPAFVSAMITMGSHVYLQISVIGPLLVVPLFLTCRLLGRFFHIHRGELADLVGKGWSPAAPVAGKDYPSAFRLRTRTPMPSPGIRRAARSQPAHQTLGAPSHPESLASTSRTSRPQTSWPKAARPKLAKPRPGNRARNAKKRRQASPVVAGIPSHPGTAAYSGSLPAAPYPQSPTPVPVSCVPEVPHPVVTHRSAPSLDDQPDLSNIPGARVIKNGDRERSGAASSRRRQW